MSYLCLLVCQGRDFKDGWAADYLHLLFIANSILPKSSFWGFFCFVVTRFIVSAICLKLCHMQVSALCSHFLLSIFLL